MADDDFDPKHAFTKLSANLEQPDKFAQIFCEAAKSQKTIDATLKDSIKTLMKSDKETREMLKDMLREVEKEDWRSFIKRIGATGWALALVVLGAILQGLSRRYLP